MKREVKLGKRLRSANVVGYHMHTYGTDDKIWLESLLSNGRYKYAATALPRDPDDMIRLCTALLEMAVGPLSAMAIVSEATTVVPTKESE